MVKYELLECAKDVVSTLDFQISALCAVGITDGFFCCRKSQFYIKKRLTEAIFTISESGLKWQFYKVLTLIFRGLKGKQGGIFRQKTYFCII